MISKQKMLYSASLHFSIYFFIKIPDNSLIRAFDEFSEVRPTEEDLAHYLADLQLLCTVRTDYALVDKIWNAGCSCCCKKTTLQKLSFSAHSSEGTSFFIILYKPPLLSTKTLAQFVDFQVVRNFGLNFCRKDSCNF